MAKDVYERLAQHLDDLPAGFPRTPERVELKLLKRLFTEEEAELACHLRLAFESSATIAQRAGQPTEPVAGRLAEMSRKGLCFRIERSDKVQYMASQYVIGIWEYHVNDLDEGLVRDMNAFLPHLVKEFTRLETPQLRTIPISASISGEGAVMPYEEARGIVEQQSKIAVADCICRKEHQLVGQGCGKPLHSCLIFGAGAYFYLANGLGEEIGKEEALRILDVAEEAGLVLQPSNAQKVTNICLCCGCCCQILKGIKMQDKPALHVKANFYARVDEAQCIGCESCLERCQMEAIAFVDGVARVNPDRCIGCGLCVTTCPSAAMQLLVKPDPDRYVPPRTMAETFMRIAKERGKL
jgi:electron transport complex protein RnfB